MTALALRPAIAHPHTATDSGRLVAPPTGADGATESAAVEAAAVSGQALFGISVLVAWIAVGLVVAVVVARRGHDLAPVVALGLLLGPLLAVYAASTGARRERETRPIVVEEGVERDGDVDVLVALVGRTVDMVDVLPVLRSIGDRLRTVTIATPVSFETAGESDDVTRARRADAADALRRAAPELPGPTARLVLLPGRPARALVDHADANGIERILVVGDPGQRAALEREMAVLGRTVDLAAPGDPP